MEVWGAPLGDCTNGGCVDGIFHVRWVGFISVGSLSYLNPNLGGLSRGSFWGGGWGGGGGRLELSPLSKTCYNYARNLRFGK